MADPIPLFNIQIYVVLFQPFIIHISLLYMHTHSMNAQKRTQNIMYEYIYVYIVSYFIVIIFYIIIIIIIITFGMHAFDKEQ